MKTGGDAGVGKGYNNRPEKTAERFIEYQGLRVYKSGDYARWLENSDVEILSRLDNQIKLRGLRIELGEVESALSKIDGIKNYIVKIAKIKGIEHLCAYFTARLTRSHFRKQQFIAVDLLQKPPIKLKRTSAKFLVRYYRLKTLELMKVSLTWAELLCLLLVSSLWLKKLATK